MMTLAMAMSRAHAKRTKRAVEIPVTNFAKTPSKLANNLQCNLRSGLILVLFSTWCFSMMMDQMGVHPMKQMITIKLEHRLS